MFMNQGPTPGPGPMKKQSKLQKPLPYTLPTKSYKPYKETLSTEQHISNLMSPPAPWNSHMAHMILAFNLLLPSPAPAGTPSLKISCSTGAPGTAKGAPGSTFARRGHRSGTVAICMVQSASCADRTSEFRRCSLPAMGERTVCKGTRDGVYTKLCPKLFCNLQNMGFMLTST